MKTILGSGQLGQSIISALLERNPEEKILVINTTGKLSFEVPSNVTALAVDVKNPNEMEKIAKQSETIFCCLDVPYHLWHDFYPKISKSLSFAIEKNNTKLVFADNMYSYGNINGAEFTENLPHAAHTKKGQIRANVIYEFLNNNAINSKVAIVKASDFIGPRIHKGIFGKDFLDRLYTNKTVYLFGNIYFSHTYTYIKDFADAMINVSEAEDAYGQIWHVPNDNPITSAEWLLYFENALEKKAKLTVPSKLMIYIIGLFNKLVKEMRELSYQFDRPYIVNHQKYVDRFGNHATDHATIVAETKNWYLKSIEN